MALSVESLLKSSPVIQSPMAACTDLPFRLVARERGLAFSFLEMVSAQALVRDNEKTKRLLQSAPEDRPLGAQLLGCDPAIMAEAARIIEDMGFDWLDLNLGCPVRKVTANGEGAALLKEPDKAAVIFRAVKRAVKKIPVTVKTRKGFEDESGNEAVAVAVRAEAEGFAAVTIHGRTQKQGYSGRSDYAAIGKVKAAVKIPVIGNGDVVGAEDALRLKKESGCDGVMIGRGGLGNPWIYKTLESVMRGENAPPYVPGVAERRETLLKHLDYEVRYCGERQAALNMRRITVWYTAGLPSNKPLRAAVCRTLDCAEIRRLIEDYFSALPESVPPPQAPLLLGE
ncbi:MAG TPA: tRNA dihydrouridine synthase DusB [Elusimicrobiota bacterium]|nr:tRNA dihydrouridine synthase DusB [Elusimicrobiota bacterium]